MSTSWSDENQLVPNTYTIHPMVMLGSASSYTDDKHLDFASLVTSMSILQTS
jgi:hypothetical protein